MELGKIEKFDIKATTSRNPAITKALNLETGTGFLAKDVEDSASFIQAIRAAMTKAGRKVSVMKMDTGVYRVVRVK